jgi:hypothetical protein
MIWPRFLRPIPSKARSQNHHTYSQGLRLLGTVGDSVRAAGEEPESELGDPATDVTLRRLKTERLSTIVLPPQVISPKLEKTNVEQLQRLGEPPPPSFFE